MRAGPVQPAPAVKGKSKKKKNSSNVGVDGSIRMSRMEYLADVKGATGDYKVLKPDTFVFLNKIAGAFERITWHSLRIEYKAVVGTTKDGYCRVGVEWGSKVTTNVTKDVVAGLTPNMDTPIWQSATLNVPASKLQTKKEYSLDTGTDIPGSILIFCAGQKDAVVGEIWVHYDVSLYGTRA